MQVWHYLAEILKELPCFEDSIPEEQVGDRGAIYNGFDGTDSWTSTRQEPILPTSSLSANVTEEVDFNDMVPQHVVESTFLRADELDAERYTYNSSLFDNTSDVNSVEYHYKVHNKFTYYMLYLTGFIVTIMYAFVVVGVCVLMFTFMIWFLLLYVSVCVCVCFLYLFSFCC